MRKEPKKLNTTAGIVLGTIISAGAWAGLYFGHRYLSNTFQKEAPKYTEVEIKNCQLVLANKTPIEAFNAEKKIQKRIIKERSRCTQMEKDLGRSLSPKIETKSGNPYTPRGGGRIIK